jgi:hypothetical protein
MAEQKIIISIQVNERESKNTNKALKVTKDNFDKLTAAEQKAIIADKQLSLSAKQLDKDLTAKAAAANAAAAATDNMRATSGLNNAIIMETSRLASDASFGFTAIANNLSQLVNLVQMNVKATGSFAGALRGLFTAQAAFLVGIQLLITYGDDLFKMLMKNSAAAIDLFKVFKDAGKEVSSTSGKFETYVRTLQDSNKSQAEQAKAVNGLKREFPDYIAQLKSADLTLTDVANKTKEATEQNNLYRESLKKLALARAAQNQIEEESSAIIQAKIDFEERLRYIEEQGDTGFELGITPEDAKIAVELYKSVYDEIDQMNLTSYEKEDELIKRKQADRRIATGEFLASHYDELQEVIKVRDKNIQSLIKYTIIETDTVKGGIGKRNAAYKAGDLDFEKERQQSRERELKSIIKNEVALLLIESGGIKERARIKQKEFVEDEKRKLDAFKRRTKDQNAIIEATRLSEEAIRNSETELNKYIIRINDETNTKLLQMENDFAKERYDNKVKNDAEFAELELLEETAHIGNEGRRARKLFDLDTEQLEQKKQRLEAEMAFNATFMMGLASDHKTQIQLQEELTQVEQDLSMKRIKIAEAEAFAKREGLRVTGDALGAFAELAGKSTGEGKALAIASTLISTYQTAQSAYESQFKPIALADSPIRGALAAAAAIARGLAQVKQIQSVKVPKEKGGGGAKGAVSIQAPDFNVVGASQTSQLAESVAGQQAKPVKAFVVGKDISTQQELDRNITNTASFG